MSRSIPKPEERLPHAADSSALSGQACFTLLPLWVMTSLGQRPRFRTDSPDVQRTIFASGTGATGRTCDGRAKTQRLASVRPAYRPAKSKSITEPG